MDRFEEGLRILEGRGPAPPPARALDPPPPARGGPAGGAPAAPERTGARARPAPARGRAPAGTPGADGPPPPGWRTGPVDEAGTLEDLSDRPLLCGDADWANGHAVVGGSDHALYVLDAATGRRKRTLHGRDRGHAEWVTSVACLPDGRILSGAMDAKLCLWSAGSTACRDLRDHSGPVSAVVRAGGAGWAASASYDKTVRLWDCAGAGRGAGGCAQALSGHRAPVLCLDASEDGGSLVSGDRGGSVLLWDAAGGASSARFAELHGGHATAARFVRGTGGTQALTGGQDGCVCLLDRRAPGGPAARAAVHVGDKGRGAVGDLAEAGGGEGPPYVVTAGADGTARVLDARAGLAEVSRARLTDFPYCLATLGPLALVGCGDGSLHVIDAAAGRTLYALGAGRAAVRFAAASGGRLVTAGDDGNAVSYRFA